MTIKINPDYHNIVMMVLIVFRRRKIILFFFFGDAGLTRIMFLKLSSPHPFLVP